MQAIYKTCDKITSDLLQELITAKEKLRNHPWLATGTSSATYSQTELAFRTLQNYALLPIQGSALW